MRIPTLSTPVVILFVFVIGSLTGCADLKAFFFPPPPAPPRRQVAPAPVVPKEVTPPPAPPKEATPPSPPPKEATPPPVAPKETVAPKEKTPTPVLSPQVGAQDAERMKRESASRIEATEQLLQQIDQKRLNKNQQETYTTIQSFLVSARQALVAQDYLRASNLADKAQVLAADLSRNLQ